MIESAQGHFVNISDPLVQCMVYEINEKPFCLIDVIGFGVFRARLLRDDESVKNLRYQNYLLKLRTPETLMRQGFIGFSDIRRHHIMHTVSGTFPINRAVLP